MRSCHSSVTTDKLSEAIEVNPATGRMVSASERDNSDHVDARTPGSVPA